MASGINSMHIDAAWKPRGLGHGVSWRCGCHQTRSSTLGSKGAGVKKRCAACVAALNAERAAAPDKGFE